MNHSAAFVAISLINADRTGLRGFEIYDAPAGLRRSGRQVVDSVLAWLDFEARRPILLWVHLYDAHAPYGTHEEKLAADVLVGKQLFYDARDSRIAFHGYLSCASCHHDGAHDGRVWDFTAFGEGLRIESRTSRDHMKGVRPEEIEARRKGVQKRGRQQRGA